MNPVSATALTLSALYMPIAGMIPGLTADKIADLGEGFMNTEILAKRVHYFSGTNMVGAIYSLVIGFALYFIVVRKLLMKNGEYLNRWPKYLDLEDYFYRPLLLTVLPGICVFICRIADRFVDSIVVLLRKSIFCDAAIPTEPSEGNDLTHSVGGRIDTWCL